jgi:hypothetical protein
MSQSDYIQFKKTAQVLRAEAITNHDLPAVLDTGDYTHFESYNLETTVKNTKTQFSRLVLPNDQVFFDIEKNVNNCATFPLCINTNQRTNRVLNTEEYIVLQNGTKIPYKPAPTFRMNKIYTPTTCTFKLQDGKVSRKVACGKNICKCKTRIYTS